MEGFGVVARSKQQALGKTGLENTTNNVMQILLELFGNFFRKNGKYRKYLEFRNFAKNWVLFSEEETSTAAKILHIYPGSKDEDLRTPSIIIHVSPPVPEAAYIGSQIEMTRRIRGKDYFCTPFIDNHLVTIRSNTESEQDSQQISTLIADILNRYIHTIYKNEMYFPETHAKLTFPFVKNLPEMVDRALKRDAVGPDMRFKGEYSFLVKFETLCLRELQPAIENIPFQSPVPEFEIQVEDNLRLGKPYNVRLSGKYTNLKLFSKDERIVKPVRISEHRYAIHTKGIGKATLVMTAEGGRFVEKEITVSLMG